MAGRYFPSTLFLTLFLTLSLLVPPPSVAQLRFNSQGQRFQLPPQFPFPPPQQPQSPQGRVRVQPTPNQPPSSRRPRPETIRPEDLLRWLPGLLPSSPSTPDRYRQPYYGPTRQTAPAAPSAPAAPVAGIPTAEHFESLSDEQQQQLLIVAVESLENDLSGLNTGAGWKKYLQTEKLAEAIGPDTTPPPTPEARGLLQQVVEAIERIADDATYRAISSLWGFAVLRVGLPIYARHPLEKVKQQLADGTQHLAEALDRYRTGNGWKKYLKTAALAELAMQSQSLQPADREILREIKLRFDEVEKNEDYRLIREANGFRTTRRHIAEAMATLVIARPPDSQSVTDQDEKDLTEIVRRMYGEPSPTNEESDDSQAEHDRIAEIVRRTYALDPLTEEEVTEIIRRTYQASATEPTPPVDANKSMSIKPNAPPDEDRADRKLFNPRPKKEEPTVKLFPLPNEKREEPKVKLIQPRDEDEAQQPEGKLIQPRSADAGDIDEADEQ